MRCPWKNASGDGLSNATFFREKFADAPLGRALQRFRGHFQRPGASPTTRAWKYVVCALEIHEYTAGVAGVGVLLRGYDDVDWVHSCPESKLHTESSEQLGQEGRHEGAHGSHWATSLSRLSLDFSFHPITPSPFRPHRVQSLHQHLSGA